MIIQSHQSPTTVSLADVSSEGAGTQIDWVDCRCRTSRSFYFIKDVVTALMVHKPGWGKQLNYKYLNVSVVLLEVDFLQFGRQFLRVIETFLVVAGCLRLVTSQSRGSPPDGCTSSEILNVQIIIIRKTDRPSSNL